MEYQEIYSKIILIKQFEMDLNTMKERDVKVEIDEMYRIGKSVAILLDDRIIGHLPPTIAKAAWTHLRHGGKMTATIYDRLDNGFPNSLCYSALSKTTEVGIRIRFFFADSSDAGRKISGTSEAKFFLAYALKHRLNSFPGVTSSNSPPEVKHYF